MQTCATFKDGKGVIDNLSNLTISDYFLRQKDVNLVENKISNSQLFNQKTLSDTNITYMISPDFTKMGCFACKVEPCDNNIGLPSYFHETVVDFNNDPVKEFYVHGGFCSWTCAVFTLLRSINYPNHSKDLDIIPSYLDIPKTLNMIFQIHAFICDDDSHVKIPDKFIKNSINTPSSLFKCNKHLDDPLFHIHQIRRSTTNDNILGLAN